MPKLGDRGGTVNALFLFLLFMQEQNFTDVMTACRTMSCKLNKWWIKGSGWACSGLAFFICCWRAQPNISCLTYFATPKNNSLKNVKMNNFNKICYSLKLNFSPGDQKMYTQLLTNKIKQIILNCLRRQMLIYMQMYSLVNCTKVLVWYLLLIFLGGCFILFASL